MRHRLPGPLKVKVHRSLDLLNNLCGALFLKLFFVDILSK